MPNYIPRCCGWRYSDSLFEFLWDFRKRAGIWPVSSHNPMKKITRCQKSRHGCYISSTLSSACPIHRPGRFSSEDEPRSVGRGAGGENNVLLKGCQVHLTWRRAINSLGMLLQVNFLNPPSSCKSVGTQAENYYHSGLTHKPYCTVFIRINTTDLMCALPQTEHLLSICNIVRWIHIPICFSFTFGGINSL